MPATTPRTLLADGYTVRSARRGDEGPIAELNRSAERAVGASPATTEEEVREEWRLPRFDLACDSWVVAHGSDLVASAQIWNVEGRGKVTGWGVVHPDHRGRGLGRFLIEAAEERSREHARRGRHGRIEVHTTVLIGDDAGRDLLTRSGYRPVRRFHNMAIALPRQAPEVEAPRGVRLRAMDPAEDTRAVHAVLQSAFVDHWNHVELSFEDWWELAGGPDLDPELWLLAETEGELAGALTGSRRGGEGWVDDLGVLRAHRRKGIGEFLLRSVFAAFQRRGVETVKLVVDSDNTTRATALYERAGMAMASGWDVYEKWIEASP